MHLKRLFLVAALAVFAAAPAARQAFAEDAAKPADPGLSDVLTDLLHGVEGENGTSGPDKRVPFGREEVQLSFAPLVKQTAPAVVNVYASQTAKVTSPFEGDPFFEEFFGRAQPRAQSSLGSGVLVDPSGVIVTNYHVIKDADEVKVATADGREFPSKVMLKDETLDLAVLKISADKPFPVIAIGDSDALEVGDLVLAIGNPFGVGQTTTSGIVSALARSHIGVSDSGYFVQTDAAINPGNSGGALINMGGQLVGINTAIYSRSGGSIGIGFAIPSNMVRAFADAAKAGLDFFERPYIGAEFELVTPQIAESLGMEKPTGALVSSVDPAGPAGKAGLNPGDVILSLNNTPVESIEALDYRMATLSIGTKATFAVLSKGKQATMEIPLERAPEGAKPSEVTLRGRSPFSGAKVAELSPRLAQRLGLRTDLKGVTVIDISRDSPAADFGFQPGDIVREVNGTTIETAATLAQVAQQDTRWWRFTVERGGQILRQVLRY
ncbi:DegQ family serine endoprotease [Mesorhizobium sp. M2D.F.Ca.ET.185.01.1.1]|uniref:DegQ family serine endoprotease n=1 Tax=unclassified Mesorhizobium TaxID=325217 RepID=UPI000FCCDBCE|nr:MULTISPECIES: DegQ family serine endoprotease [unclassified Mesorhizobium]TGP72861.1 DegQ family serine endoprotease [bacterium M00.F.Ca.ET.227.01.1.1]TGP86539.1 DegQ family serine endoprotease [bacterium M00.F.Ca.ET.221.01.1.1]TGP87639.1 DegQ family serine endoprotease [bacterium M00.F.Ca.ET.222.01.1.1]TGT96760.1 DegQ family serine endoprotease [bacterium M00.F.Ca.ET.163.01.1.1]TGU33773.1 DegQ family serine endoprotease [bacterium M00.F.Ca.ET.156.01.1.1]TGU42691.1 DegQ family serine endop